MLKPDKNPILITGGAGYIGSHTAAILLNQGFDVVVFDDLSTGHKDAVPNGAKFIHGSLLDESLVAELMGSHSFSAVMHFAARSLVGESMAHPFKYIRENVTGALNIIEHAVNNNVKKFILSSTANLFGHPETIPIDEGVSLNPGSPYGESKHIIERILLWADQVCGMRYACLRYFNAAGADPECQRGEDHDPETHLIPIVLQVAAGQRDKLTIFGDDYPTLDGTCIRDYIHVNDLAKAHILALNALDKKSVCYNLGSGSGYSVKEVVDMAARVTGKQIPTVDGPRRLGDPAILIASSEKIQAELGWKPVSSSLENIIKTAWKWHSSNPEGFFKRNNSQ